MKMKLKNIFKKGAYWVGVVVAGLTIGLSVHATAPNNPPLGNVPGPVTLNGGQTIGGSLSVTGNLQAGSVNGGAPINTLGGQSINGALTVTGNLQAGTLNGINSSNLCQSDGAHCPDNNQLRNGAGYLISTSTIAHATNATNATNATYSYLLYDSYTGNMSYSNSLHVAYAQSASDAQSASTAKYADSAGTANYAYDAGNANSANYLATNNGYYVYPYSTSRMNHGVFDDIYSYRTISASSISATSINTGYSGSGAAGLVGSGLYGVEGFGDYIGTYGQAANVDGLGVYGYGGSSATGVGVYGYSSAGIGLSGTGGKYGVYATTSMFGTAIYGKGGTLGYGVKGEGGWTGVVASGITGLTASGTYGADISGSIYGIYGTGTGAGSTGVYGYGIKSDFDATGPGVNYAATSSIRWKHDITEIDSALEKVLNMRGVYYTWDAAHGGQHDMGMIAEEVGKQVPEVVVFDDKAPGYASGMDYGHLTPVLVEAIKEQQKQIEDLKSQIEILKNK